MHAKDAAVSNPPPRRRAAAPGDAASRLLVAILLALAAVRGVSVAGLQLPFNGWDELPHLAVAYYVHKTGRMPTTRTPMPRELVPFITAHPHPTTSLSMLRGINAKPYPGDAPACCEEPKKRFDLFLYQAQHGPLFYRLMALFCPGPDPAALLAWADAGRLCNVALLVATLALWRLALGRLLPADGPLRWLPDGVLLLLVSFSYVTYNFARFANDGLALFCASAALAAYVVWIKPRGVLAPAGSWRTALLGALAGLAVLAKATALPVALVLGILLTLPALRPRLSWRARLRALAAPCAFVLGYVALAGAYHLPYLMRYGQLTGMQEAIFSSRRGFGLAKLLGAAKDLGYGVFRNPLAYNATVFLGGWSNLQSPDWQNLAFKTGLTGCALALGAALCRRGGRRRLLSLALAAPELPLLWAGCTLALVFHALHSALAWGFPTTGAWYAMPALPAFFTWLLLGPALLGRLAGAQALLYLAVLFNWGAFSGTYGNLLVQETGTTDLAVGASIAAAHHALIPANAAWMLAAQFVLVALGLGLAAREALTAPGEAKPLQLLLRPRREHAGTPSRDTDRTGT
ncbi:hypothetical protein [Solidesulfovibrio sp.]|uniref:hypothetical protein n=1 Tax=Solidesulfovibrio sp. TaxID=2910990 RepID=UPI002603E3F7|nr:hypothetical protein [Solidesulfovibrio sp.]